jgi:GTP:adenosylcobinamide-phosphate guanylyltransferase
MAVAAGVSHKALLPVGGRPMIARVIDALRATPALGPIAICIESPEALSGLALGNVTLLPAADGPARSVANALRTLGTPLLVTTADNALLRPDWIESFLAQTHPGCDVAAAITTQDNIRRDVPTTQRTLIRLADGSFSGCNLFLFRTAASRRVVEFWEHMERERKRPWRMARLLGLGILLRYATGRLTRAALYARILRLTGARARLITLADGRACVDVDKPSDLALANRLAAAEHDAPCASPMS